MKSDRIYLCFKKKKKSLPFILRMGQSGPRTILGRDVVVHLLSHVQLFAAPSIAAYQASLFFTISWNLLKLVSIESMMPSNHLILCYPLLLLPSIFPSIQVFFSESALLMRWLKIKYWSFSFSMSPSNEYSGLIFFRMDWLDILAVQGLSRIFCNTTVQKYQILVLSFL